MTSGDCQRKIPFSTREKHFWHMVHAKSVDGQIFFEYWVNCYNDCNDFRSDDTLIQNGDRFGAGDVYFAIHEMEEILDYICVNQSRSDGDSRAVLFVKLKEDCKFTPELKEKISKTIERELWIDCVPKVILEAPDIPYNLKNKKMERAVRQIVATNEVPQVNNIKNPDCLKFFCDIPELVNYDK